VKKAFAECDIDLISAKDIARMNPVPQFQKREIAGKNKGFAGGTLLLQLMLQVVGGVNTGKSRYESTGIWLAGKN